MAELVFNLVDVTLDTSWTVFREAQGKEDNVDVPYSTNIVGSRVTRSITISGIPDGEVVKRAMLTATLKRVGMTDYGEAVKVNNLNFGTGTRKLDSLLFSNDIEVDFQFYYCASGDAGFNESNAAFSNYSCTLYLSNITLTLTTGTGSAFDGLVGSLPDGSKILVDEADGVQGTYSIVHHGYNEGLCLLWRDNVLSSTSPFNHGSDTFLSENGGLLDTYLNETFYESLPDTTKSYIQLAAYPTRSQRSNGEMLALQRYVCTPSVRELKETTGYEEWYGYPFDYIQTVACNEIYWTRSVSSTSGSSYRIGETGSAFTYDRSYPSGVRPCFCVLEDQIVVPSDDGTYYTLTSKVDSPSVLYLNGEETNLFDQQRDKSNTLSWSAVENALVTGYEAWSCDTVDGNYAFLGAVSAGDDGAIPTELTVRTGSKGFETLYYKVKAVTTPDTDYLDSDLSADTRSMATKRTNVHYYDGTLWLLAGCKNYNNSVWEESEVVKYYDGIKWVPTNEATLTTAKLGVATVGYLILGEGE